MLNVYPIVNWDSFISVVDADTLISGFVASNGVTAYLTLDTEGKEAILRQTALQMKLCKNITLPDTNESDLGLAQCYLTVHALETNMLSFDSNERAVTSETVDVISVTYNANLKGSNYDFPYIVSNILGQYGCTGKSSGAKQVFLGRN